VTHARSPLLKLTDPGPFADREAGWTLTLIRASSASVFIVFGVGKFVDHGSETASFRGYGLPQPAAFVDMIGILELLAGLLLLIGLGTRGAAALLAADMVGAVILSGVVHGETISLTLAPALLAAMLIVATLGPGRASLDALWAARRAARE
jgi:putative oxidoreductase